jgi:hypothetical protein
MGNNAAFTSFEATVIAVYNHGALTKPLLIDIMKAAGEYSDIDSGGMVGTLSKKDKLDVIDIVLKTFEVKLPPRPRLPKNHKRWTDAQDRLNENWHEARWEAFFKIAEKYGW